MLILAAGKSTRFKSDHSKMLHGLAGRPLGEYVLRASLTAQPDQIYMVIGHEAPEVLKVLGRPGVVFVEQKEQLGTGHALITARPELAKSPSATLVAVVGDAPLLRSETLRALVETHGRERAAVTVLTTRVGDPTGYGRIVRAGGRSSNRVRAIVEEKVATPAQRKIREINSGILCFSLPKLLKHLDELSADNAQKEYLLTDLVGISNRHGEKVVAFPVTDSREVLGVNDRVELAQVEKILRLRKAEALARAGVTVVAPEATYIDEDAEVGRDTIIEPGVSLFGRTRIGRACTVRSYSIITDSVLGDRVHVRPWCVVSGCEIASDVTLGPFAHLRDGARIEQEARIGNFVEIKKSRVGRGSKASHLTYLGDATLGENVNIGAGTITCNYDGENKNPTFIDDGAFVGSGSMLVAPVRIGKGSYVGAGSTITHDVPADSLGLGRAQQVNKEGWARVRRQPKIPPGITIREVGPVSVLNVTGRLTLGGKTKDLGLKVRERIEAGYKKIVINLSGVDYIDSTGIGELVSAASLVRATDGQLKLAGVQTKVLRIFEVAKLGQIFEFHPDEASALARFD